MEWPPPSTSPSPSLVVRSPRQTVSLIRNRRPHRDWAPSTRSSSFAARDHGPKPSEVYGFVGSITTVIATAVYLAWAYTPEPVLRSVGITYYPSKYDTLLFSASPLTVHDLFFFRFWSLFLFIPNKNLYHQQH
jgi:phosphatidylinositol glycan class P protein